MKSIGKVIALMVVIVAGGCDKQQEEPAKPEGVAIFKTQQEALEKAKQVEGVIQDADEQQREQIDEQSR